MERRLDGWDLLVIYLDGIQFGDYHVLGAVGVDSEGHKHVLGVREGASENAAAVRAGRLEGAEVGPRPGVRTPAPGPAVRLLPQQAAHPSSVSPPPGVVMRAVVLRTTGLFALIGRPVEGIREHLLAGH